MPGANELMAPVHTRMPVILHRADLHRADYDQWLYAEDERNPVDLLRPYEASEMACAPCNPQVGNVRNNGPEMLNSG